MNRTHDEMDFTKKKKMVVKRKANTRRKRVRSLCSFFAWIRKNHHIAPEVLYMIHTYLTCKCRNTNTYISKTQGHQYLWSLFRHSSSFSCWESFQNIFSSCVLHALRTQVASGRLASKLSPAILFSEISAPLFLPVLLRLRGRGRRDQRLYCTAQ